MALVALGGITSAACGAEVASPPPEQHTASTPADLPSVERDRIVTVYVTLEVGDVGDAVEAVHALVAAHRGYVQEAEMREASGARGQFYLRIPSAQLAEFRGAVADLGQVTLNRESAADVTSQRADISARVRNGRAEEARLLRLLDERTGDLADVLAVEGQLSRVRESVERMVAQERVLAHDVGYAHVHLDIAPTHIAFSDEPGRSVAAAATNGLEVAWTVLVGITVTIVAITPTALLLLAMLAAALGSFRLLWRWRRHWTSAA